MDYNFDTPFTVLSFGPGYWGGPGTLTDIGGNVLEGVEGHGVIQFQGTIETLSWTIPANEFWHGFTIGVVPEPSSVVLLVFGAIPLAWRWRRSADAELVRPIVGKLRDDSPRIRSSVRSRLLAAIAAFLAGLAGRYFSKRPLCRGCGDVQ